MWGWELHFRIQISREIVGNQYDYRRLLNWVTHKSLLKMQNIKPVLKVTGGKPPISSLH